MGVQLLACSGTTTTVENVQPMPIALSTKGRFGRWIIVRSALVGALGRPTLLVSTAIQTGSFGQQDPDPEGAHLLDIEASIFQRFIHAGPLALKKGRQRQFRQRLRLTFTQQGITQVEQRIGSSFHAGIDLLTNVLEYVKVHCVQVLCFFVWIAKNFTSSGSFWQASAAFWFPLV